MAPGTISASGAEGSAGDVAERASGVRGLPESGTTPVLTIAGPPFDPSAPGMAGDPTGCPPIARYRPVGEAVGRAGAGAVEDDGCECSASSLATRPSVRTVKAAGNIAPMPPELSGAELGADAVVVVFGEASGPISLKPSAGPWPIRSKQGFPVVGADSDLKSEALGRRAGILEREDMNARGQLLI